MKIVKSLMATALLAPALQANAGYVEYVTAGMTTQVAGATVYTFDNGLMPSNYTGSGGAVMTGSVVNRSAQPAGDATAYLSVAGPTGSGTQTFLASGSDTYNYFGLYWGSIDAYNSLTFYNGDTLVASISGLDVIGSLAMLGDQSSDSSNRYVNFLFDTSFNRVVFGTTNWAFESDNHAFGNISGATSVPEPGTLGLLGIGLLAVGAVRRRIVGRAV